MNFSPPHADGGFPLDQALSSFLKAIDRPASFLEVGVGEGRLTVQAARRFGRVVAVDRDPRTLITARPRVQGRSVSLLVMDAHRLEFPDHMFDAVGEFNAMGHFDDPGLVVEEMLRVTRPGGVLLYLASWRSEKLILRAGWLPAKLAKAGLEGRVSSRGRILGLVATKPGA